MIISDYVELRKVFGEAGKNICGIFKVERGGVFLGLLGVISEESLELPRETVKLVIRCLSENSHGIVGAVVTVGKNVAGKSLGDLLICALEKYQFFDGASAVDVTEQFMFREKNESPSG